MYFLRSLIVVIFLTIVACTTFTSFAPNKEIKELRFIGDFNLASETAFQGALIGGLSGLTYDSKRQRLLAISDDRGEYGEPRFYEFKVKLTDDSFQITPLRIQTLKSENGKKFRTGSIDFEGMTLLENGQLLISSEGDDRPKNRVMPGIHQYDIDGKWLKNWPIDAKFHFESVGSISKGVRFNRGFESLTSSPDGLTIFAANENTLLQDGVIADERNEGVVRIIRYQNSAEANEYAYTLETLPNPSNLETIEGDTGLVDMVAFDQQTLITMERSWNKSTSTNSIRLFNVSLVEAEDISGLSSLANRDVKRVKKTPLLDLDTIVSKLHKDWKKLDNIEGIAFGPTLANGHKTLILVSDNNFSQNQRTLFLAFEIIPN